MAREGTDATLSTAQLAERVGLSTTPCWRRVQNLEKSGVIRRRVAILDPEALNVAVDVFVTVRTNQHNAAWYEKFTRVVTGFPEVLELYRTSGEIDYLMRVMVPDLAAFDSFYKRLVEQVELADVSSSFAMERIKYTTELPLTYV